MGSREYKRITAENHIRAHERKQRALEAASQSALETSLRNRRAAALTEAREWVANNISSSQHGRCYDHGNGECAWCMAARIQADQFIQHERGAYGFLRVEHAPAVFNPIRYCCDCFFAHLTETLRPNEEAIASKARALRDERPPAPVYTTLAEQGQIMVAAKRAPAPVDPKPIDPKDSLPRFRGLELD